MGVFVVLATGAVALPAQAAATVITVSTTADSPVGADCDDGVPLTSLRQALCWAGGYPEAVVELVAGTYTLTAGALVVDPGTALDVTLRGAGAATTTIDAGGASRVLDVDPSLTGGVDLTVEGVTLRGGVGAPGTGGGGAILAGTGDPGAPDSLTLRDCALTANRNAPAGAALPSDVGAAVSMAGGALRVERCTFSGNTAWGAAGGAIGYTGVGGADTVDVVDSALSGNTVDATTATSAVGGALDVAWGAPTTTVTGTRFEDNMLRTGTRPAQGSAVRVAAGTATLTGVTVRRNQAVGGTGSTGAVHLTGGTVSDSAVVGNTTETAGGTTRAGVSGATSAVRTWWGCRDLTSGCDSAGGATTTPHATTTTSLSPSTAPVGATVTATVAVGLSDGAPAGALLGAALAGTPVTWAGASFATAGATLGSSGTATATFAATGPATVTASVDGADAGATLAVAVPPTVVTEPADVTVAEGASATFTATATGSPAPTVQWWVRHPGADWSAATGSTSLTISDIARGFSGLEVRAVFTSSAGTVTTRTATVTVTYGPEAVTGPQDVSGLAGSVATFTASAAGRPAPSVRWQTSPDGSTWTDVAGATSWTYSRTLLTGDAGLRVRAVVSGAGGDVATSAATVTLQSAPTIVLQPTDVTVLPPGTAVLVVAGSGVPAPTVVWERRTPGGTWQTVGLGTTLTLPGVAVADHGTQLRATLTNQHGSVTSDVATLSVPHGPVVTQHPADVAGVVGDEVTSTAAATGHPAPTVQWQTSSNGGISWTNVPGATSWTWTRTLTTADDGTLVRALVTGHGGAVATGTAAVTARYAPTVTDPADATVVAGEDASFAVTVTGSPVPSVTWQRRAAGAAAWTDAGAGTSLELADVTPADHGTQVRAVVSSTEGSATSAAATLTVRWAPLLTQQPAAATALAGEVVTFTAAGDGNPTPTVQWQTSPDGTAWTDVPGATSWTYARTVTDADHDLRVRAVATNAEGVTPSDVARVTVDAVPAIGTQPADATVDVGTDATFEVAVTGRPAPAVQWQAEVDGDWVDVPGATGTTLVVPGTDDAHGTRYRAVATSTRGTATSDAATLEVLLAPTVTDPQDVATAPGEEVAFTVDVTGRPVPDVVWEASSDGVAWAPVGTGTTLTLTPTLADDGLLVRAVATSTLVAGPVSVTSAAAELVVAEVPELLDGPGPLTTVTAGVPTTLAWTVRAADATALWEVSRDGGATWTPVPVGWTPGTQAAGPAARAAGPAVRTVHTLALTPTAADEGALVRLTVTSPGGSASASTVLDVVAVVDPGTGGGGTGGSPGSGGTGSGGTGVGTAPTSPASTSPTATAGHGASLPRTGADPLALLALGTLLAAAGVVTAVAATRRREPHA